MKILKALKNIIMGQHKNREAWQKQNAEFLKTQSQLPEVNSLGKGVLYKVLETGEGTTCPQTNSVVTCHYRGSLIDGKVFDSSFERSCPEAFRCRDLIPGFTAALLQMHEGDRWEVYIPFDQGYGTRSIPGIPGCSTLIFEVQLIRIG